MEKEIRIFDDKNSVLKVKKIRFDLLEVNSGVLIDTQNSDDLNPPPTGTSNEWGVKLSFTAKPGPLEVYTTDPNYRYPGNTIQSLEGTDDNRIDIDLLAVPVTGGGQGTTLTSSNSAEIVEWVDSAKNWKSLEKRAVLNLISNYRRLKLFWEQAPKKDDFHRILEDWEIVLKKLNIEISE